MSKTRDANQPTGLTRVFVRSTKTKSGKVKKTTSFRISSEIAKKAKLQKGRSFSVFVADDGTTTLVPVPLSRQRITKKLQNEILSALEETHRRFGNALRQLAE